MNQSVEASAKASRGQVLVVDDHARARQSMADILTHVGHVVACCSSAREALDKLATQSFDVIVTDLMMPGMSGVEFIRELSKRRCESQVVMVTAHASVETAVQAMRHGAFDYIEKPFDIDQLERLVQRALSHGAMVGRRSSCPASDDDDATMVGQSEALLRLFEQVDQTAETDVTVLIQGESGTGKELVAKRIHRKSRRCDGPLVSLNCPALSPQLMESELFGHERGAFTSADSPRVGRFELAHQGSILLDEVTEVDLQLQSKLLRVLQEKNFERVGSSETIPIDVRVIASTNRDLQQQVQDARFREDLYYRLAVVPIQVPPLRDRGDDKWILASHFLEQAAVRLDREPVELEHDAKRLLMDYHWPGNVRELENLMTRATVLHAGQSICAAQLAPWLIDAPHAAGSVGPAGRIDTESTSSRGGHGASSLNPRGIEPGTSLQEMERALIEATLEKFEGHREKTAKALGIGVRTLSNKLRSFGYAPREKSYAGRAMARSA